MLAAAVFVLAAAALGPLPLVLSPVALVILLGYSYAKRFTWASHLALGLALAGAPLGAWIAVTGSLALEPVFARARGLDLGRGLRHDLCLSGRGVRPRPGPAFAAGSLRDRTALRIARGLHLIAVAALVAFGLRLDLGPIYAAGVAAVAGVLLYEHSIVHADDLSRVNRAFFDLNGLVSLAYLVAVLAAHPWSRP